MKISKEKYLKRKKMKAKIKMETNRYNEIHFIPGVKIEHSNYYDPMFGLYFPTLLMLMANRRGWRRR